LAKNVTAKLTEAAPSAEAGTKRRRGRPPGSRKKAGARARGDHGPHRFKQRELARVVRAANKAGGVERIEVALDGRFLLIMAKGGEPKPAEPKPAENSWDEVHAADKKRAP